MQTRGFVAEHAGASLVPITFERRDLREHDVAFDVLFSGICHSDIHQVNEEWGPARFPMVPGHEIVGVVTAVGASATKFQVGDHIGVGVFIDSCRECEHCLNGEQQYCLKGMTLTYNAIERDGTTVAFGGYSNYFVVDEAYAVKIPDGLDLAGAAPLLCAGVTLYSPLRHWGASEKTTVGIIGLGGLGHMGVKLAAAMGATTTVFSHSANKHDDAKRLGASSFVDTTDPENLSTLRGTFDLIINTVSADLDLTPYLDLLKLNGTLVVVGLPSNPYTVSAGSLAVRRRSLAGSNCGGMKDLQEMMDFCAEHNVTADVEVVKADYIGQAYARTVASDVKYRFVIDASTF
jgi:alcohol dehydrogenase (NADP+)